MKFVNNLLRPALFFACVTAGYAQLPAGVSVNTKQYNFSHQLGSTAAVSPQTLQVISAQPRAFTVATQLTNPTTGPNWLTVNGAASTSGTTSEASSFVTVSVVPAGLTAGVYTANIRVELAGTPVIVENITVYLRVSASPQIVLNVTAVNIQGQAGTQVATLLSVSSTSTAIPYSATVSQYYGASGWLSISPADGNSGPAGAPATVAVTANLTGVSAGLHYAVINFRSNGPDGGDVSMPVILTVTQTISVSANPTSLAFGFQASNLSATPNNKQLTITATSNAQTAYTASLTGDSRITLSKSSAGPGATVVTGTTPESIFVLVNPVGIPAGTSVDGQVTITTSTNSVSIPVRVTVTNSPLLVAAPESLTFAYTLGTTPPGPQTMSLTSTSGALGYAVSEAEVSGGDWLTVATNNTTTPGNISASLNTTRIALLAAGTYTANITIASPTAANTPLTIPVTLTVSGSALVRADKNTLAFSAQFRGQTPAAQTLVISSTDNSNQTFVITIEPTASNSWLLLSDYSGATGVSGKIVTVNVSPNAFTQAGVYEADIVITPQTPAGTPAVAQRVKVTFNVTATTAISATPDRVTVTQSGTTAPAPVSVQIASPVSGIQFLARSNQPWVTVAPTSGTIPSAITLTFVTTGMAPGTYEAIVTIAPSGANELNIPVSLTIQSQAALTVAPLTLAVNYVQGTPAPAASTVALTSSGVAINFTAVATSTGNWLSVTPASGTTTATGGAATNLTITANPAGLAPGTYTGTVAVTGTNSSSPAQTVTVTLTVSAVSPAVIRTVESAARNETTLVAPGLILQIKGSNLGPATGVGGRVTNGVFDTTLSEVRVLFDGTPAPVLYARQDQVNAVAPYSLFGRTSTRVQVEYRGIRSDALEYRVVDLAPGIFTQDASGRGLGAILNQNNTVNTQTNPARRGEIIAVYATGEGVVRPAASDGRLTTGAVESLPRPMMPVTVRLNGQLLPAENVVYAGAAPGLVAGAMQVNVRIPADLSISGATLVPIEILVGSSPSQSGVTVSVTP